MDDGIIKFKCSWSKSKAFSDEQISKINTWRDRLFNLGLIGAYSDGTGFGNISIRADNNSFIITGTGTGGLEKLTGNHYTLVHKYDVEKNSLSCKGPIMASSESLSHAMIYDCSPETNAVIHIHNMTIWKYHFHKIPTSRPNVLYGTVEMAHEIIRLFKQTDVGSVKKIIMGGHQEGVIAFGRSLDEAGLLTLEMLNRSNSI